MSDLEGVNAKLDRAEQHLEALNDEWRTFAELNTYRITTEFRPDSRDWLSTFHIEKPIPISISLVAGDLNHNLRSALDHLVARMVERHGGTVERYHAFPIYPSKERFHGQVVALRRKRDREGPLHGIPRESPDWALVEESQPYHRGDQWRDHPLAVLSDMSNFDKHQALHAGVTTARGITSAMDFFDLPNARLVSFDAFWNPGDPLVDGTKIARFAFDPTDAYVKVKNPVGLQVALGDLNRGQASFREVVTYVRSVVERAEVFFL